MILEEMARRYQQLYLVPKKGMSSAYQEVVTKGKKPEHNSLELFSGSSEDELFMEETPSGPVEILFLKERKDFEHFLQIMVYKCEPASILPSVGAMTLNGVTNWEKINRHKEEYLAQGGWNWGAEFKKFTSDGANYKDTIIVISDGPYSGISAEQVGYEQEEWLAISKKIRIYHECAHVICRRCYPQLKEAVWDEVVADCIGLLGAMERYDIRLARMFLGAFSDGYHGGRLENYVSEMTDRKNYLDQISKEICQWMQKIKEEADRWDGGSYYDFLIHLEEEKDRLCG